MGIRTTVDQRGVVQERVEGADSIFFNVKSHKQQQYFTAGTGGSITGDLAVFAGTVVGVTGVLPVIGSHNVGLEVQVINANLTQDIQVSASQPIDLGTFVLAVAEEAATFLAISSSTGYSWICTHMKA